MLKLPKSFEGMWFPDGVFDPIGGEIFSGAPRKIEHELFAGDWAEANTPTARNGPSTATSTTSSPTQRVDTPPRQMAARLVTSTTSYGTGHPDPEKGARQKDPDPLEGVRVGDSS
jgi:hypothetical protein